MKSLQRDMFHLTGLVPGDRQRGRELRCLSGVFALAGQPDKSVFEVLREAVLLLPSAGSCPEARQARIAYDGNAFTTPGFRETAWMQHADLVVSGSPVGRVEVACLDEASFPAEERLLVDLVAECLATMIERKNDERLLCSLLDIFSLSGYLGEREVLQRGLGIAEDLTHSKVAFLHFVSDDPPAIERVTWSRNALG
jgi:hypothetical protein